MSCLRIEAQYWQPCQVFKNNPAETPARKGENGAKIGAAIMAWGYILGYFSKHATTNRLIMRLVVHCSIAGIA